MPEKPIKMSRKIGAMSTMETVAIVGGGLLLVYLFMSKSTTPTVPVYTTVPTTTPLASQAAAQASEINTIANDSGSVLNNLINSLT